MQPLISNILEELKELTQKAIQFGYAIHKLEHYQLAHKPNQQVWSIYECIEHLNLYGDHYLKEMELALEQKKVKSNALYFKGSLLGNYFVKIIRPVDGGIKKMKTANTMDPNMQDLDKSTIARFIEQQLRLLDILDKCQGTDLKKIKIKTTLSKFLSLNLGDTLRFVVYHNQRHVVQAAELLHKVSTKTVWIAT
jgi:hypothetical protein